MTTYGYLSSQPIDAPIKKVASHSPMAGHAIGILAIDIKYPLVPGNIVNATSFQFPVLYKILHGVDPHRLLSGDPDILSSIISGGRELISYGARAIVGACGSFANYQRNAVEILSVPTYLSIMTQVPFVLRSMRRGQKLGIIAADARAITPAVLEQCDIADRSRLVMASAMEMPEFRKLLSAPQDFSSSRLDEEIGNFSARFVEENPDLGAILLQCSDLPPYALTIQRASGLPVYDMALLINWLQSALVRQTYSGFM